MCKMVKTNITFGNGTNGQKRRNCDWLDRLNSILHLWRDKSFTATSIKVYKKGTMSKYHF